MFYPYHTKLQQPSQNMPHGNFGLWYNKFMPLNNFEKCEACGKDSKKENAVEFYASTYSSMKKNNEIKRILERRHIEQVNFCNSFSKKYRKIVFTAVLKTPLITGIGESHPHKISMVFDHNMGIPYIPASGIKGIVRFAHTLGLLYDENGNFTNKFVKMEKKEGKEIIDEEDENTFIPHLFGTQGKRGSVAFLDAYPEHVPDLHIDIMNPHYGDYYSDEKNRIPPADYLTPVPIKFLTVAKGTIFVFRAIADKANSEITKKVKTAFRKAFTEEGAGAKTAVGYGIFDQIKEEEPDSIQEALKKEKEKEEQREREALQKAEAERFANMSEDEKILEEIKKLQKNPNQIAPFVKKCLEGNYQETVYRALKQRLEDLDEWKLAGSKQRKASMRERNAKIEEKLND